MQNIKKYWPAVIAAIIIIFAAALIIAKYQSSTANKPTRPEMIFFYGSDCPHCKNVEEYLAGSDVRTKLSFQELEVYNNQKNAQLLAKKARECNIDTAQGIGVPFFFDGQNCIVGDEDIINFFKTK